MKDNPSDKMNGFQVVVAIIKCVVGTGSFFLPQGIAQAGIWGGIVGLLLMAVVTMYLNWIILSAKLNYNVNTYHELCFVVLGPVAGWLMFASIIITNLGACSVYLVTGATLLGKVSNEINFYEYLTIFISFELLISWLPTFKYLAWTSIVGIIGLLTAMIGVFVYGFSNDLLQPISSYPALQVSTYANFFSVAAFLYIQPSTFFPIVNAAAHPEKFNIHNSIAYVIIAIANTIFATIAYMFFGDNTKALVLENLCPGCNECQNIFTTIVQVSLFVDVIFTFPLIMSPAYEVIENSIFKQPDYDFSRLIQPVSSSTSAFYEETKGSAKCGFLIEYSLLKRNVLRTVCVLATFVVAALVNNISGLVGIISGVTLTFNAFIMGPLIHLKWKSTNIEKSDLWWLLSLCGHTFIILSGMGLGVWSTYLAVESILTQSSDC